MSGQPDRETVERWHRWFAVECNNRAWELASASTRDELVMIETAHASRFHWAAIGTPLHVGRADMLLAPVYAVVGEADLAMRYARRYLATCEDHGAEDRDLAFAHAEVAFAASVAEDRDLHAEHHARATALGNAIADEEDRAVFLTEFARIPAEVAVRP